MSLREDARQIWDAAVAAARPRELIARAFADASSPILQAVRQAPRILVVGGGKAGAAMSAALEDVLGGELAKVEGVVNVPAGSVVSLKKIRLHAARPAATNQPTAEGVEGSRQILDLVAHAGARDVALCLISGGGSAILLAPVDGVSLEDKQKVTKLLHACGATINEMNAVRKHLSRLKGGGLARAFGGRFLFSLIISDVVGDPLDVIASGPTAADPSTFADAWAVLEKYSLETKTPPAVRRYLQAGVHGQVPETLKSLPSGVFNYVIGNNAQSLTAAQFEAERLGYRILNLGSFVEGETQQVAPVFAGLVRSIRHDGRPLAPPVCLLSGGETTVTLPENHGLGGRSQEFVLAVAARLGPEGMANTAVLSGGTDGEDGPTDAAGAVADLAVLQSAAARGLSPAAFLVRHDAYHFFQQAGGLIRTGLTQTNVMDVRVILIR